MRKQLVLGAALAAMVSGSAMADAYVGAKVGVDSASFSNDVYSGGKGEVGYGFGLSVGYDKLFDNKLYAAGEISYLSNFGTVKGLTGDSTVKATGNKSLDVKLGYEVSRGTVVYGKVGRGGADLELSNSLITATSGIDTKTIGVGFNHEVSKQMAVTGEFRQVSNISSGADYTSNGIDVGLAYHF
jgi:hypothetical protein